MFLPGSPCTCCGGGPRRCPECSVAPTQALITFSRESGGGAITPASPDTFPAWGAMSIECEGGSHAVVVDIGENCQGFSERSFFSSVYENTEGGPVLQSPQQVGREAVLVRLGFDFRPIRSVGLTTTPVGGNSFEIFPGEALYASHFSTWSGSLSPWKPDFPFRRTGGSHSVMKHFLWYLRERLPPEFDMFLDTATGSGATFKANQTQHTDGIAQPYWKVPSVDLLTGGDGYTLRDMDFPLASATTNNAFDPLAPRVFVSGATPKIPTVNVWLPGTPASAAVFSCTLKEIPRSVIPGKYFFEGFPGDDQAPSVDFSYYCIDSVTLVSGGAGYQPNAKLGLAAESPGRKLQGSVGSGVAALRWSAQTNAAGVVTDVTMEEAPKISDDPAVQKPYDEFLYGRGTFQPYFQLASVRVRFPEWTYIGLSGTQVTRTRTSPVSLFLQGPYVVTFQQTGAGAQAFWSIASITAGPSTENTDWLNGAILTFLPGDFWASDEALVIEEAPAARVVAERIAPEATLVLPPTGSGASLSLTLQPNGTDPATWGVASVTVNNGGAGYINGSALSLNLAAGSFYEWQALLSIVTGRIEPTLAATVSTIDGEGASLVPVLAQSTWGPAFWYVTDFTISSAGTGYAIGDQIYIIVTDGQAGEWSFFYAEVSDVDEDGAITAVSIFDGGEYWKDSGVIESVTINDGGGYYKSRLVEIQVTRPGKFYRQFFEATATPIEPADCLNKPTALEFVSPPEQNADGYPDRPLVGQQYLSKDTYFGISYFVPVTRRCAHATVAVEFQ